MTKAGRMAEPAFSPFLFGGHPPFDPMKIPQAGFFPEILLDCPVPRKQ
jgi:hypothetical protein